MNSLLVTFLLGLVGIACIAFGFLYRQDGYYPGTAWYDVLKNDLAVRISFWVIGLLILGFAGFFQFKHHRMMMNMA